MIPQKSQRIHEGGGSMFLPSPLSFKDLWTQRDWLRNRHPLASTSVPGKERGLKEMALVWYWYKKGSIKVILVVSNTYIFCIETEASIHSVNISYILEGRTILSQNYLFCSQCVLLFHHLDPASHRQNLSGYMVCHNWNKYQRACQKSKNHVIEQGKVLCSAAKTGLYSAKWSIALCSVLEQIHMDALKFCFMTVMQTAAIKLGLTE